MPLSEADLRILGDTPITIESTAFPEVFLRMDGTGVPTNMAGGGTVNCNFQAGDKEKFKLRPQANGTFSIESIAFPNVFLRLVGSGVTSPTDGGGGLVNCQINANGGGHETFWFRRQANGNYSIESAGFPEVFLRMDGSGVNSSTAQGGGQVNFSSKPVEGPSRPSGSTWPTRRSTSPTRSFSSRTCGVGPRVPSTSKSSTTRPRRGRSARSSMTSSA
ncbi:hypothetical protein ACFFKH_09120 [Micromonospora marina]|uniref:hypothetical protein n=1 Tax=Micromonospora marina TaxID=307120 RepID=UPI00114D3C34|nr:hypothetical protein [Micromonospora marina]